MIVNIMENTIQDNLHDFLNDSKNVLSTSGGRYGTDDFIKLNKILNNTKEDFLIFDNGGGKTFEIIFDRVVNENESYKVKDSIKYFSKNHKSWIYCYQIDEVQHTLKKF
jgi:hypothetical protein